MKKFMFGFLLFIGALLCILFFPITASLGPWTINLDTLALSMFTFIVILITGFTICIYEAYIKK
ncbi:hypothetical protein R0131_03985 [Clostridium sp. AL.422]|uniref:hypothetical protein n=1 Tax=Clostridium TaxID=1485 RepID=UPI00293DDD35|nr:MULTISPECIES: hypothetical protein [unclassified Clostridium]MDV4149989.1 hypothetical protein [Clostridium sp. AL.422]